MDFPAFQLTITRITALVMAALGLGLCFVPLLGVHGPESALLLAAVCAPLSAAIGARHVIAARRRPSPLIPGRLVAQAVAASGWCLASPLLLLALNAARVKNCDPLGGLLYMLLGPIMTAALAALAGTFVALLIPHARWATALAVSLPGLELLRVATGFYTTPAIFAYGHAFGYFPGTLYDAQLELPAAYLSFRLVTVGIGIMLGAWIAACYDPETQRLRLGRGMAFRGMEGSGRGRWFVVGVLATGGVLAAEAKATDLGHRSSAASIAESLGGRIEGPRCHLLHPRELDQDEAERLHADCEFRVAQMERRLGVRQPRPIRAYLFRSAAEKRALMGAGNIYIAKPWRDEIYLQLQRWPHPVFAHEIAHVVAGNFGIGPFRIAGHWGGLWPNPSLIEGLAVAAAWSVHDGLTVHQWARAMLEQDLAPSLAALTGANFLAQPKGQAYTLSGSFVRYVLDRHGAAAVRQLYMHNDLSRALGKPLEQVEREWHAYLRQVPLPSEALALARVRFERRGVFSAICPHELAVLQRDLHAQLAATDYDAATQTCRKMLSIDPRNARTRTSLVHALSRGGAHTEAQSELDRLLEPPGAPATLIAAAREALADAAWREGRIDQAQQILRGLSDEPLAADMRRQIEIKQLALQSGGTSEALLFELLVGPRGRPADPVTTMHLIRELAQVRPDGLADYLEARQLFHRQQFERAARWMARARSQGLPTTAIEREALRVEAIARYAAGQFDHSDRLWWRYGNGTLATAGTQAEMHDWRERIAHDRRAAGQADESLL